MGKQRRQEGELLAAQGQIGDGLVEQGTDARDLGSVQPVGSGNHESAHGVIPGGDDGRAATQGAHGVTQNAFELGLEFDGGVVVGSS